LKWDAVGSILKQTKRKHQLTIKTCTITMKTECSEQLSHRPLKLKSHFTAGALGDSIRFGIFVVYQ
jgi:hypothetical protein